MKLTTLCYIEREEQVLMLHRISKKNDPNKDKWIGVGGHFEDGESPEDCLLREVREETGLVLKRFQFRGLISFVNDCYETEYMCLYTSDAFEGELTECDEGRLEWIPREEIFRCNLWEGDRIFLKLLMEKEPFFSLKLVYHKDTLMQAVLNGENYPFTDRV